MPTYTSTRPITVDGVRLDTLAWNVTKLTPQVASRRSRDQVVAGVDGVTPSLHDTLDVPTFGLEMWLRGTDSDGATPGVGQQTQLRNNLDELLHLFGKRHALLDVQEQVDGTGTLRRAWCKVTDAITPDLNQVGTVATFTVGLQVVYGAWEDLATQDWSGALNSLGATQEITTLQGATERTNDAILLVTGPIMWPKVTDVNTGAYVALQRELFANETWRVNCGTFASRYGTSGSPLTLGSADTAGTEQGSITQQTGLPVVGGTFLPLAPVRDAGGVRRVQVNLTEAGTPSRAAATGTRLTARTKRRWAT